MIKNWRPISLTNGDYKLLTVIGHENGNGPSKNNPRKSERFCQRPFYRRKHKINRRYKNKLNKEKQSGILLMLDFEKVFDSVEWGYMLRVLNKFNFGPVFQNWVKICYTNISSTVMNNGFSCGWFNIKKGVRQGCPLSTVLFILCIELLAQLMRTSPDIKGISFGNTTNKISLFADDATCILKDIDSIKNVFKLTNIFSQYSGLKLNVDKSVVSFIGVWRRLPKLEMNITIQNDSFNMLGIELGNNLSICHKISISNKIDRMATRLNIWSQRNLSLIGKVNIAKSMGISNLIYSLNCVQCKESHLKEAQSIVNKFIWSKRPCKIKHWSLAADYDAAGINSPDLITMQKSLRLAWLQRIWTLKSTNEILHLRLRKVWGSQTFDPFGL